MKIYKVAGTMVAGAAACLLLASQASAAVAPPGGGSWDFTFTTADSAHGATLYVEKHGDYMTLCDSAADGKAAHADISIQSGSGFVHAYYLVASGGNGTCVEKDASDGGAYDLPEGVNIGVTLGLGATDAPESDWSAPYGTVFDNNA